MRIKCKQNKILWLLISILLLIFVFIFPLNKDGLLVINFVVLIVTLIKARVSLISLWSIITNYVMINVFFYDISGVGYGILGLSTIDFALMLRYMLVLNISFLFWSVLSDFTKREKNIIRYTCYNPGKNFSIVCCVIAVLTTLIAFPTVPFTFTNRFEALLPGNAWNHFALVALIFVSPNIKKYKFVKLTYIFVICWFLSHYERVDVLGLAVALLLIYVMKKKEEIIQILKVSVIFLILFILMSFLGEIRMASSFSISGILTKLVTQNTASDVGYMYSIAVDYISTHSLLFGETYLKYVIKVIPILETSNFETATILGQYYGVPGGSFILDEPLMNFGLLGVIIIPNFYIGLVYSLIKKITVYRYIVFLFIFATAFRYLWYGVGFIETGILWLIPFIYFIYKIMRVRRCL